MNEPSVSVVVPAFNAASTILAQLEALAGQHTTREWEVIVADNGSTDATAAVVDQFAEVEPRVRRVDASARRGASAARNIGAQDARGRFLLFCDADDVAAPTWLEEMARMLDSHDLAAGELDVELLNADNTASVTWKASGYVRFGMWPEFWAAPSSCLGIRADAFAGVTGFDPHMPAGEDVDLCWRVQLRGGTMAHSAAAVMHVRRRDGLRQVAKQAYVWGSGEKLLAHKYAHLADSGAPIAGAPAGDPSPTAARRLHRLAAVRRLGDLADPVWRLYNAAGRRWARVPADLEPLSPDYRKS